MRIALVLVAATALCLLTWQAGSLHAQVVTTQYVEPATPEMVYAQAHQGAVYAKWAAWLAGLALVCCLWTLHRLSRVEKNQVNLARLLAAPK